MERQTRDEIKGMCFLLDRLLRQVLCEIDRNSETINAAIIQMEQRGLSARDTEYFRQDYKASQKDNQAFRSDLIAIQHSCHAMFCALTLPKAYSRIEVGQAMARQLSELVRYANSGSFDSPNATIELIPSK